MLDLDAIRDALARHAPGPTLDVLPGLERRDAGVLVPLRAVARPTVVLTARAPTLRDHAGEVCFPGGKPAPSDPSLAATALREASEEIGLDPARVELAGRLSPVPTATSAYRLNPFVGLFGPEPARWSPSPEVARVIEPPLDAFARGDVGYFVTTFPWRGAERATPFFELDAATPVYGATAYVLCELFAVLAPLGLALPPPRRVAPPAWTAPLMERFLALRARAKSTS